MTRPLIVAVLVLLTGSSRAAATQNAASPPADLVILALGAVDESQTMMVRAVSRILGRKREVRTLRDVQLEIIRNTVSFGPVLLLVPDEETYNEVIVDCATFRVCEAISNGRLSVSVVSHNSPWLRDYGPFVFTAAGGAIKVVDASYYDVREDDQRTRFLRELAEQRIQLVKHAIGGEDLPVALADALPPDKTREQLELLRHYSDVVREQADYGQRTDDDRSSFAIAQALIGSREFNYLTTPLFIDGGNLLILDDGACLTTTALHQRNPGRQSELSTQLKSLYDCREVIYLEPLPGPVIEHVDMFVLPAGGRKLLLPDYRLDQPHVRGAWRSANNLERDLTFHASLVMEQNAADLRARGYEVVLVPALLPRVRGERRPYYPTMLNALVRSDGNGRTQVLVPSYAGLDVALQRAALEMIQQEFGPRSDVRDVESTIAAQGQGAVHCLTITVPLAAAHARAAAQPLLRTVVELRAGLDAAELPEATPSVRGVWSSVRHGRGNDNGRDAIELTFTETKLVLAMAGGTWTGDYRIHRMQGRRWDIELMFEGMPANTARVEWLAARSFRLSLEDGDTLVFTRPVELAELNTDDRELVAGASASSRLSEDDQPDPSERPAEAWLLRGRRGDVVRVSVQSSAFDAVAYVVGPGLDEALYNDDSVGSDPSVEFEFLDEGPYKLVVRAYDSEGSGDFTVNMAAAERYDPLESWTGLEPSDVVGLPIDNRRLQVGRVAEGRLDADAASQTGKLMQAWHFERCDAGGRVRIDLRADDFDPVLVVFGSGMDAPLVNDDDVGTDAAIEFDCVAGTTYRAVVSSWDVGGPFKLEASVVTRERRE